MLIPYAKVSPDMQHHMLMTSSSTKFREFWLDVLEGRRHSYSTDTTVRANSMMLTVQKVSPQQRSVAKRYSQGRVNDTDGSMTHVV